LRQNGQEKKHVERGVSEILIIFDDDCSLRRRKPHRYESIVPQLEQENAFHIYESYSKKRNYNRSFSLFTNDQEVQTFKENILKGLMIVRNTPLAC